jgi:1-aminocyclopropane-1-carboxylate deaminase/D-cysteine desulfhydrase-like pyridoxal-dependent ACC family enzyme
MITAIESHSETVKRLFQIDINLKIKRDDLYPFCGGGTKARKMKYIMQELQKNRHDVIVTNGGPQSNHARATALMAAQKGMKCHLVIVLEPGVHYPVSGNLLLMRLSGAVIEFCTRDELGGRMDQAVNLYRKLGQNPAYIWGGGHCHAGTVALVDAAKEAQDQCGDWIPDFLIHASGTGTTQAGLAIGYSSLPTRVIGISVARPAAPGGKIVKDAIEDYYRISHNPPKTIEVNFRDDWTCGGYEKICPELSCIVEKSVRAGLVIDPTYSGKALYGLIEMARCGDIPSKSNVLFWHTGGLMNLIASHFAHGDVSL